MIWLQANLRAKVQDLRRELSPETHKTISGMLRAAAKGDVPDRLQLLVSQQLEHIDNPRVSDCVH